MAALWRSDNCGGGCGVLITVWWWFWRPNNCGGGCGVLITVVVVLVF